MEMASSVISSSTASESSSNLPTSQTSPPRFQAQNDVEKPPAVDPFEDMDSKEYIERFSKYESDYTARLMAKYFSDKDVYGDKIFEDSVTVNGETIKSSRFHCAQSYADPIQYLKDKKASSSLSGAQTAIKEASALKEEPANDNPSILNPNPPVERNA